MQKNQEFRKLFFFGGFFPRILFNGFLVGLRLKELLANDFLLKGMFKRKGGGVVSLKWLNLLSIRAPALPTPLDAV